MRESWLPDHGATCLLRVFAESRVVAASRAQGWEAGPGQLGKVMGEIRQTLSVTVVRGSTGSCWVGRAFVS